MLLLLLSRFSRVRLCAAHQAPPSLGFSRQEYWSGLPFPSPVHESESEVASVVSDSVRPHRWQPIRLLRPWDSPGKNTGVSISRVTLWIGSWRAAALLSGHGTRKGLRLAIWPPISPIWRTSGRAGRRDGRFHTRVSSR